MPSRWTVRRTQSQFDDSARVILSVGTSLLAIAVAVGIGVVFGVYPASRAARLAPIDALRNE